MIRTWGIRREDKNKWEKRVPLVPQDLKKLSLGHPGHTLLVQPSPIRIFPEDQFAAAGATIQEDLSACDLIMGVKEMPISIFQPEKTYFFFSHTLKGQPHNMPMLKRLIELKCDLLDYERIVDDKGRRLVFFGRYAGLAGMIDTLWAFGQRLKEEGLKTPFASVKLAHEYSSLEAAKEAIRAIGREIEKNGLPTSMPPMVVGFTGYGNVSKGAQEIFDLLPHQVIAPADLLQKKGRDLPHTKIGKVVYHEEHTVKIKGAKTSFDLQDYFKHPGNYESIFRPHLDLLTILVNCIYWSPEAPRVMTKQDVAEIWKPGTEPQLKVIGDISCDIDGGIEFTMKETQPDDPVYTYDPKSRAITMGVKGHGPVVMAVDNLPCELSAEASHDFSKALMPFMPDLLEMKPHVSFAQCNLPKPLLKAMILWRGELTPDFAYLKNHVK